MNFPLVTLSLLSASAAAVVLSGSAAGAQAPTVITDEFSKFVQDTMQANNVSGLSVGVLRPDDQVEYGSWGERTEEGDPITPGTLFNLGSCSKAFLPAALGILMQDFERGENKTALPPAISAFNWDTKMQDLLPGEWLLEDPVTTKEANLKDLLSHQTGLPEYEALLPIPSLLILGNNNRIDILYSPTDTTRNVVLEMRNLHASYEFRERFEYINIMYLTGAHVVEKYSGISYRDFVEKRIMKPIGMSASTLSPDRAFKSGNMTQSWTPEGRRIRFFFSDSSADLIAGDGGVMSSAEDMLKWVKLQLNGGVDVASNTTIIPPVTFDFQTSALSIAKPKGTETDSIWTYGLGWLRLSYRGHEVVKHNGGAPGVSTWTAFYPHDNFGLVVLENTGTGVPDIIERAIADRVLNLSSEKITAQSTSVQPTPTPATGPGLPISRYAGTYMNLAFGNVTFCSPESTSSACKTVLRDFHTADRNVPPATPELYSAWPRFWCSHFRFVHIDGESFGLVPIVLYPDGYGADKTPFANAVAGGYLSKFLVEKGEVAGFGVYASVQESKRSKKGGNVRDTADAWFDKVA
ncbi:beta-lactamase/transpeptidase-like protein [Mycena rebaudengoi]|nr:beta-lactamase/transpeptidase-like protein [Mycena rebaudengoi]